MNKQLSNEFQSENPTVYPGDCVELIPELPDESIDVVVTSPPYWGQAGISWRWDGRRPERLYRVFNYGLFAVAAKIEKVWDCMD